MKRQPERSGAVVFAALFAFGGFLVGFDLVTWYQLGAALVGAAGMLVAYEWDLRRMT